MRGSRSTDRLCRRGGRVGSAIVDFVEWIRARFADRDLWCENPAGGGRGSPGGSLECLLVWCVGCGQGAWCGGGYSGRRLH